MSDDYFGWDTDAVEPSSSGGYAILPAGDYRVKIVDTEKIATRNGGQSLRLVYEVVDGEHAKARTQDRLCIVHSSLKAQEIARGNVSAIITACGKRGRGNGLRISDLHGIPFMITLGVRKDDNDRLWQDFRNYRAVPVAAFPTPPEAPPYLAKQGEDGTYRGENAPW